ncbi:MAG: hypothetical protein ABWX90_00865 [Candidatus Saccharimonadales bacterium]
MKTSFVCREGFWRNENDSSTKNLPRVKARAKPFVGHREFLTALNRVQSYHEDIKTLHAKGWSNCRCCEKKNGSVEFKLNALGVTWAWPSGYVHYVEDHNVRPSLAFQEWVLAVSGTIQGTKRAAQK